jgi:uncharacterized protein (DUF2236 family)
MKNHHRPAFALLGAGLLLVAGRAPSLTTAALAPSSSTAVERQEPTVKVDVALRNNSSLSSVRHPAVLAVRQALEPVLANIDSETAVRSIHRALQEVFPGVVTAGEPGVGYKAIWDPDKMTWVIVCCRETLVTVRLGRAVDVHIEVGQILG